MDDPTANERPGKPAVSLFHFYRGKGLTEGRAGRLEEKEKGGLKNTQHCSHTAALISQEGGQHGAGFCALPAQIFATNHALGSQL